MVSEKPDEQNPANPDDHDANFLFDEGFLYGDEPNTAICTYCGAKVMLGAQAVVGEMRAVEHRQGLNGGSACTEADPNPDAGRVS